MNKNVLIVLGGAVLAAVLVAMLVQVTIGGKEEVSSAEPSVQVLVAAKDLEKGTELGEGDLKWKKWSEDALFKGAIMRKGKKKADEVLKGRLDRDFSEGEALVRKAVLSGEGNMVAARLQPGERAVSIKVNVAGMVAGFLAPGSYVDVVLTYQSRVNIDDEDPDVTAMVNMNLGRLAAETILQNVRVLAVDQRAERKDDDKIKVGKTVTLAVSARQAEKLALAAEMGDITLAMRGVGDDLSNKAEPAITDARMSSIDDEIYAEYLRMKQQTQIKSDGITVYSGSSVLSGSSK